MKRKEWTYILLFLSSFLLTNCQPALPEGIETAYQQLPQTIDFNFHIRPLLSDRCYSCHGPDEAESGLRFVDQESAFAEADSGEFAIVAGDVESSMLITRITSEDEFERIGVAPGVIFWSADKARLTRTMFVSKLAGHPMYKELTVRNHNTTRKLDELLADM